MSLGEYINLIWHGMIIAIKPITVFGLLTLSCIVILFRWWVNHFNLYKANSAAKTSLLVTPLFITMLMIAFAPIPTDSIAWALIGIIVWCAIVTGISNYIAVALSYSTRTRSYEMKLAAASYLRDLAIDFERSAEASKPIIVDPQPEKTLEVVKEVIMERANELSHITGFLL